jgi:putative protease
LVGMKKPELLAPGGSFLAAYYAFEAGADGVYLGLTEFSARKSATNFTFDQLRRIRGLAARRGRKIYVTLNTIVRESEIGRLVEALRRLEILGVDGVIVQDLGVLSILRESFPGVPVHASTQMAVHNASGIGYLKGLGVRRIILSRELTLDRIKALRLAHPDVELEVFVHGALCYGFSGVCLASSVLTGRSGNRGDCAQICRGLFRRETVPRTAARASGGPLRGHFFSCRDLFLGLDALDLADAGVDAFKIEGRMKSPEYVFNVTRLYREVIDRGRGVSRRDYDELVRKAELTFARRKTTGFLRSSSGTALIDTDYPGHRGAVLGTIEAVEGGEIGLTLSSDLSLRDGLALFSQEGIGRSAGRRARPQAPGEPFIFAARRIRAGGRDVKFARKGRQVRIEVPDCVPGGFLQPGRALFHLSSRFLDLPQPKEASFPPYKVPVGISVRLRAGEKTCSFSLELEGGPEALAREARAAGPLVRETPLDYSDSGTPLSAVLRRLFGESGRSLFGLGGFRFTNESAGAGQEIFVPPSALKKMKNDFYARLDALFLRAIQRSVEEAAGAGGVAAAAGLPAGIPEWGDREALSGKGLEPAVFAAPDEEGKLPRGFVPAESGGFTFITLPPVVMDDAACLKGVEKLLDGAVGTKFAIGLSNISHLGFARALRGHGNAWFFIDFPLYVANAAAFRFFSREVERLLFQYFWIEGDREDCAVLRSRVGDGPALIGISPRFRPPLFYAMGCFAKHVLNGGTCIEGCERVFDLELGQGGRKFRLAVRDCVTYLSGA